MQRSVGSRIQRCFNQPRDQASIVDGPRGGGTINSLRPGFLKYSPVQIGTERTASGSGDSFAFAVLLPNSTLDVCSSGGTLELQQAPDLSRYSRPKRIGGHDHPPMDSNVVRSRKPAQQIQSVLSKGLEFGWHV